MPPCWRLNGWWATFCLQNLCSQFPPMVLTLIPFQEKEWETVSVLLFLKYAQNVSLERLFSRSGMSAGNLDFFTSSRELWVHSEDWKSLVYMNSCMVFMEWYIQRNMETSALCIIFEIDLREDSRLLSITPSLGPWTGANGLWICRGWGWWLGCKSKRERFLFSHKPERYKSLV